MSRAALVVCMLASACVAPPPDRCADAATCVAGAPIPVGTVPNDVRLARCGGEDVVLVPASFDARLDAIALDGTLVASTAFPAGSAPWSAVPLDGGRAAVSLFGAGEVDLVAPCTGEVLDRFVASEVVEVSPAVALRAPLDADGDGSAEVEVDDMVPRSPQALAARDDHLLATFTNFLAPGVSAAEPPLFGPGVVVALALDGDRFGAATTRVLPSCIDPQGLIVVDERAWISCSGRLGPDANGAQTALDDGALLALDPASLDVTQTIDAARFAPGTPAVLDGAVVVGSLVTPRVALLELARLGEGARLADAAVLELPGADVDSVFEIASFRGVALAPVFSRDRLFPIDVARRARVEGFDDGLAVGPGGEAFRGALALDVVDGFSVDGVALLGLSAEVVPLSLAEALP